MVLQSHLLTLLATITSYDTTPPHLIVCAELGTTLKKSELETAVFILDKNSDGKISFDEFRSWWVGDREDSSVSSDL